MNVCTISGKEWRCVIQKYYMDVFNWCILYIYIFFYAWLGFRYQNQCMPSSTTFKSYTRSSYLCLTFPYHRRYVIFLSPPELLHIMCSCEWVWQIVGHAFSTSYANQSAIRSMYCSPCTFECLLTIIMMMHCTQYSTVQDIIARAPNRRQKPEWLIRLKAEKKESKMGAKPVNRCFA